MAPARLLIIAPNDDLRRSLAFALEAEGFEVVATDRMPGPTADAGGRFDCTVLDHKALTGSVEESIAFCVKARPVVLLASRPIGWLTGWVSQFVEMPANDGALAVAVYRAIEQMDRTSGTGSAPLAG